MIRWILVGLARLSCHWLLFDVPIAAETEEAMRQLLWIVISRTPQINLSWKTMENHLGSLNLKKMCLSLALLICRKGGFLWSKNRIVWSGGSCNFDDFNVGQSTKIGSKTPESAWWGENVLSAVSCCRKSRPRAGGKRPIVQGSNGFC